jgi:hypothetical protein
VAGHARYLGPRLAFCLLRGLQVRPRDPLGRIERSGKGAILAQLDHKAAIVASALGRQGPEDVVRIWPESWPRAGTSGGPPGTRTQDSLIKSADHWPCYRTHLLAFVIRFACLRDERSWPCAGLLSREEAKRTTKRLTKRGGREHFGHLSAPSQHCRRTSRQRSRRERQPVDGGRRHRSDHSAAADDQRERRSGPGLPT